jgi:cytochrome c oxidase cbb3-type subunit 3
MFKKVRIPLKLSLAAFFLAGTTYAFQNEATVKLYNTYCVQCHGLNRNGKGVNTHDIAVQPRDHTDPKGMGDMPDDELTKAITEGGLSVNKSVIMPRWGLTLSTDQVRDLVSYLRVVCKCGPKKEGSTNVGN